MTNEPTNNEQAKMMHLKNDKRCKQRQKKKTYEDCRDDDDSDEMMCSDNIVS